jgi:hypothetical protein
MRACYPRRCLAAALISSACSDSGAPQDSASMTGIVTLSGTGDETGVASVSNTTSVKLDVGEGSGTGAGDEGGEAGCKKVDFLFVIDSSPSMEDEQDNLLVSFPGFITAIEDTLMIDDFHLMVVDASVTPGAGCDGTLGAGRTTSAAGQDCMLVGGTRYATEAQPDLIDAFTCMASRGFAGDPNEQTMSSLTDAIGPLSDPGGCNEGFVRDDAILVVTIITDEEDSPSDVDPAPPLDGSCTPADADPNSSGDPMSWRDEIVAIKNGDADAVVVLSLLGDCDEGGDCPGIFLDPFDPNAPITGAEPAPRLRQFTQLFGYGSLGPVCAADYAPFFADAVSVIESACSDFVPPG